MIGDRIRQRREEKEQSLAALARQSVVSRNYLFKLERGLATNPSAPILQRLADALGTTVDDLLEQEQRPVAGAIPEALRQLAAVEGLTAEDMNMLAAIQWRGRRPVSAADWRFLYEAIRRAVAPE